MIWLLIACSGTSLLNSSIVSDDTAATAAKVQTVIEVSFTLDEAADVHVAYTLDGVDKVTPTRSLAAGDHMMRVLGVPAAKTVTWSVVAVDSAGETHNGEGGELRVGNIPSAIPTFNVNIWDETQTVESWMAGAIITTDGEDVQFVMDRDGNVVWYHTTPVELVTPWAEPSLHNDKRGILINEFQEDFCTDVGQVVRYDMSGEIIEEIRTIEGHHVFLEHEDGTIAYMARDVRDVDGYDEPVCGDKVVEVAPDGTNTELFTIWDHHEVTPNNGMEIEFYCDCIDWTHSNMLGWYPDKNTYLFSFANTDTVVEFDRDSGELIRQFGKEPGSYVFDPLISSFARQHGVSYTDTDTFLVSQTTLSVKETTMREYTVDDDSATLVREWEYGKDLGYYALALGEAHRLPNGNTLANFGSAGIMQEVNAAGEIVWESTLDVGGILGRTVFFDDIYDLESVE